MQEQAETTARKVDELQRQLAEAKSGAALEPPAPPVPVSDKMTLGQLWHRMAPRTRVVLAVLTLVVFALGRCSLR